MYCEKCGKYSGQYPLCKKCYNETLDGEYVEFDEKKTEEDEETTKEYLCPICEQPTYLVYGKYPRKDGLCSRHAQSLKNGWIELAENGRWRTTKSFFDQHHMSAIPKYEQQSGLSTDQGKVIVINPDNKSRCITCGRKTDGLLFCSSCYSKYCGKDLLFRITECSNVELLDDDYEGRYTCKDGHVVKSKSERDIDNFLFEKGIPHAYEKTLPFGKTEKEVLHPDFYLPHYLGPGKHVWIEHWGYNENNLQYEKTKKFKVPIYERLGITLVCTYEKTDAGDIESALERKLNKENIEEGKIN